MANSAAPLMNIFGTTDHLIPLILDDLSDAESRVRARGDDGPSIAWHLGHLLSYRHQGLQLLGQADGNPYEEAFERSPATDGRDYPTELSEQWSRVSTRFLGAISSATELSEQWSRVSTRFLGAISSATEEAITAPVTGGAHAEESVCDKIAFLAFHEGYHIGGIAALQKTIGKSTPAEKIVAAMKGGNSA